MRCGDQVKLSRKNLHVTFDIVILVNITNIENSKFEKGQASRKNMN